jgi:hypothetical protein
MKKQILILLFAIVLFSSCTPDPITNIGFRSEFGYDSVGLSMMSVPNNGSMLRLNGTIRVETGGIEVKLIDPNGELAYFCTVETPGTLLIEELYRGIPGIWRLQYKSIDGKGEINLHVNY